MVDFIFIILALTQAIFLLPYGYPKSIQIFTYITLKKI
jgi:hypothetical protein